MSNFRTIGRVLSNYGLIDLLRKVLFVLMNIIWHFLHLLRKLRFYFYTRSWPGNVLGRVIFNKIGYNVRFGRDATFYNGVIIELSEDAILKVGEKFTLAYGAIICCHSKIIIGDEVMVGEYSSIRDTSHSYKSTGVTFREQIDYSDEIIIMDNVWIGRGCIILPGTIIEQGVVIAANSVVKGKIMANSVYGGTPATFIKQI